jgi:uncharacterized protein (TIGR02145 family)
MKIKLLLTAALNFGLCVASTAQTLPAYLPTDGLVGWWPFNGNANDESGNEHDGTTYQFSDSTDRFGNTNASLYFDGIDDFIQIPHHPALNSLPFSISFWMKSNGQTGIGKLFNKVCCSSWNGWDIEVVSSTIVSSGTWHFEYYNSTCQGIYQSYCNPQPFPVIESHDDTWHHCIFTIDSTEAKVFWDGALILSQNWDGPPVSPVSNVPLDIARYGFGNSVFYQGLMDDVGIWNKALSEQEINSLYTASTSGQVLFTPGNGVTDIDGNSYSTVIINGQEWMSENLNVSNFCNGDPITNADVWPEWFNMVVPRRASYEASDIYREQFGQVYNFWAVRDERNLCPCDWHVATLSDYQSLETYLGGNDVAAGKIKGVDTWIGENLGDLNASGLNMLAGGDVADNFYSQGLGNETTIWLGTVAADDFNGYFAQFMAARTWAYIDQVYPMDGHYVRCVKDGEIVSQIPGCMDIMACNYNSSATISDNSCIYQGSSCNDGNDQTINDSIDSSCNCAGELSIPSCSPLPVNLQNGLLGYWPFCGNANDESGNGNNGVVNGAILTTDRFANADNAYIFDGNDDVINISNNFYNQVDSIITISMWYKMQDNTDHQSLFLREGYNFNGSKTWILSMDGENYFRYYTDCCTYTGGSSGSSLYGSWQNIVVVFSNFNVKSYINGVLVSNSNLPTPFSWSPQPILIGESAGTGNTSYPFLGQLDDIGIWNRALTTEEVQQLYTLNACTFSIYDTTHVTVYDTVTTYTSVTDTLIINTLITELAPPANTNTIKVFPNPAGSTLTIDYGNFALMNGYQLRIENSIGQQVFQTNISQQSDTLSLGNWGGNGLYFVHIVDSQGNTIDIRKIILQ